MFIEANIEKVRDGGRVARNCVVVAHAVHETGRREIMERFNREIGQRTDVVGTFPATPR